MNIDEIVAQLPELNLTKHSEKYIVFSTKEEMTLTWYTGKNNVRWRNADIILYHSLKKIQEENQNVR
jgi:hypothetical protein